MQYSVALHPSSFEYAVIEVNQGQPFVGACFQGDGLPDSKVSTKIAIGYTLDEITNAVTGKQAHVLSRQLIML